MITEVMTHMLPTLKGTGAALLACSCAAAALLVAGPTRAQPAQGGDGPVVEHKVLKDDNLSLLAGYYYGNPRQWRAIYSRNSDRIGDPGLLIPGTVLKVETDPDRQWTESYDEFLARVRR